MRRLLWIGWFVVRVFAKMVMLLALVIGGTILGVLLGALLSGCHSDSEIRGHRENVATLEMCAVPTHTAGPGPAVVEVTGCRVCGHLALMIGCRCDVGKAQIVVREKIRGR